MIIKDIRNNNVCYINLNTGEISTKYNGFKSQFILPIGSTYIITRNKIKTIIKRETKNQYNTISFELENLIN